MSFFKKGLLYVLIISIPFLLIITSIRLVISPIYLEIEYRLPGFPSDIYGFSFDERMQFAKISANYLVNPAGIEFLANFKIKDGSPLFNDRELSHMQDVKILTTKVLALWKLLLILFTISLVILLMSNENKKFWSAILQGGWLTLALVAAIILGVLIDFDTLFTAFHRIFFTGDTWLFYLNDSLIRLFPERFWMDVFFFIGGFSILFASLAIYLGRKYSAKSI